MEHSNHWYGHTHILARYCGVDADVPPRVWAALQHGWNIEHGFGNNHWPHEGFPRLVWSDVAARRAQARGWRDLTVIGSPWAYLLQMMPPPRPPEERSGAIFYPFHTWDYGQIEGDHRALIDQVMETEGGDVTACLYWIEYNDDKIRSAYESAGCRVITHGFRGKTRHDTDPTFLQRQYAEMVRHRRVVSNRLTTAVLYGISVGCRAGVYGDPMIYSETFQGGATDGLSRVERLFPELHQADIPDDLATDFARRELGLDRLASPAELRHLLGWTA